MNINALDREQPSHYLLLNHAESGKSQACLKPWNLIGVKFWYSICHGECETVIPETVIPETVIPFPGEQVAEDYTLVSVSGSEQTINAMATSDSSGSLQYIYIRNCGLSALPGIYEHWQFHSIFRILLSPTPTLVPMQENTQAGKYGIKFDILGS